MSIRIMTRVWDDSPSEGAELLLLLAMADWADDRGECNPSYSQLAKKARVAERVAKRLVAKLVKSGELEVVKGGGFRFRNGAIGNKYILLPYRPEPNVPTGKTG